MKVMEMTEVREVVLRLLQAVAFVNMALLAADLEVGQRHSLMHLKIILKTTVNNNNNTNNDKNNIILNIPLKSAERKKRVEHACLWLGRWGSLGDQGVE